MGLLSRMKRNTDWDNAYDATPNFYTSPQGNMFGAFALTEGTDTILPLCPKDRYQVDGKSISDWRVIFVSTSDQTIMFELPYSHAITKLEPYFKDKRADSVLIKGLTLNDLKALGAGNYFSL